MVFYILLGIFALGLLVFIHELGHFLAGKAFGVKVREFMVGLPSPKLVRIRRGETDYGITILPFGGYVKFSGMDPTEELTPEEEKRSFDGQPVWKRLLILAAGPGMNLLLASVIFAGVFMYGVPMPTTTIDQVLKGYPAQKAGIVRGDRIVAIDSEPVDSWDEMVGIIRASAGERVSIDVQRDGRRESIPVLVARRNGAGFLGVGPRVEDRPMAFVPSVWLGIKTTGLVVVAVVMFLIELPSRLGLLSQARGPVGLVQESARAASEGFRDFAWLVAAFSVSLGVFNLIPLPPLDGGKVALAAVEGLFRRRLSRSVVLAISAFGASLLILLMVYIVVADIGRLLPSATGG
ncbi:MAG: RIP metalloprotease [Actinobacteria bacterium]|nr:MAG: RIP metalloprotease [Actinomycetota bacterium]